MLNSWKHKDRGSSPLRHYTPGEAEAYYPGQDPVVHKKIRSPRPQKKRPGHPLERCSDPSVATCSYGDDAAQGLSQLSDIVILDASQDALSQDYPAEVASPRVLSQEEQDTQPSSDSHIMLEAPPSQPDIPLATVTVAQAEPPAEQQPAGVLAPFPHHSLLLQQQPMVPQRLPHMDPVGMQVVKDEIQLLHPKSRATRRGPMDEMRQLVRILVKVVPHSVALISSSEEGGGGNRISEEQIKSYLENALGEAPRPTWGLPNGWGDYCSTLFTWVLQRPVSIDQAMRCAKREPGRSWEALEGELLKLGLYPSTWPLPLTKQGLYDAARNPSIQPILSGPVMVKKQVVHHHADEHTPVVKAEKPSRKRAAAAVASYPAGPLDAQMERLSEAEVWQKLLRLMEAAKHKQGTSNAEDAVAVSHAQLQVRQLMQEIGNPPGFIGLPPGLSHPALLHPFAGAAGAGPASGHMALVPVMLRGPDGSVTSAFQLQPVPPFYTQATPPTDVSGMAALPALPSLPLLVQPGPTGSAFQAVPHQPHPLQAGSVMLPQSSHTLTKPQPIRPRIGAVMSAALPSAPLNGLPPDPAPQGSSSPSTMDEEEQSPAFDINSILRPTPSKPGNASQRRAGESQEAPSQSFPIPSLNGTDLAVLHNSQGTGTSLSAFRNAYSQQSADDMSSSQQGQHKWSHLAWSQQSHDELAQRAQQAQHHHDELSQRAQHALEAQDMEPQHAQRPQPAQQAHFPQVERLQHANQEHPPLQAQSQQAQQAQQPYKDQPQDVQHAQQLRNAQPQGASQTAGRQRQTPQAGHRAGPSQSPVKAEVAPSTASPPHVATGVFSQHAHPEQSLAEAWAGSSQVFPGDTAARTSILARQQPQQQHRPPKRKLPFSIGVAQDAKRHSPETDLKQATGDASAAEQPGPSPESAPVGSPDVRRMSPYRSLALHPSPLSRRQRQASQMSPLGEGAGQSMSPSMLLDLSNHPSPVTNLASQQELSGTGALLSPPIVL